MCTKTIKIKDLTNYLDEEILVAKSSIKYWERRKKNEDYQLMYKHWKAVLDTLKKTKSDLIGLNSVIPELATKKKKLAIVLETEFPKGTYEYLRHYQNELKRLTELEEKATGDFKDDLSQALIGIRLILESYDV